MNKEIKKDNSKSKTSKRSKSKTELQKCKCCDGKGELIDQPKNLFSEPLRTICPCCKGTG